MLRTTVQPQTPVSHRLVRIHLLVSVGTGLRTGAFFKYIGGSSDYHIDTQIMKSVPMEQKVKPG